MAHCWHTYGTLMSHLCHTYGPHIEMHCTISHWIELVVEIGWKAKWKQEEASAQVEATSAQVEAARWKQEAGEEFGAGWLPIRPAQCAVSLLCLLLVLQSRLLVYFRTFQGFGKLTSSRVYHFVKILRPAP